MRARERMLTVQDPGNAFPGGRLDLSAATDGRRREGRPRPAAGYRWFLLHRHQIYWYARAVAKKKVSAFGSSVGECVRKREKQLAVASKTHPSIHPSIHSFIHLSRFIRPPVRSSRAKREETRRTFFISSFRFVQSVLNRSRARETRRGSARVSHLVRRIFLHPSNAAPTDADGRRANDARSVLRRDLTRDYFFFLFLFIIRATFE